MAANYRSVAFDHHGRECEVCGATEELHVHHKDQARSNNDPDNLEVLCEDCHWDRHRDEFADRASGPQKGYRQTIGKSEKYRENLSERMSGPRKEDTNAE